MNKPKKTVKAQRKVALADMNKKQLLEKAKELSSRVKTNITFDSTTSVKDLRNHIRHMMSATKKPVTRVDESGNEAKPSLTAKSYAAGKEKIDIERELKNLNHQIKQMQGERHEVGNIAWLSSPVAKMMGKEGNYQIVAVLEEQHGMRRYFLEGMIEPVEGRYLKPYRGSRSLRFNSPLATLEAKAEFAAVE